MCGRKVAGESFHIVRMQADFLQQFTWSKDADDGTVIRLFQRHQHGVHHQGSKVLIRGLQSFIRRNAEPGILQLPAGFQHPAGKCRFAVAYFFHIMTKGINYLHIFLHALFYP